jgi:hypothetical protein
VTRSSPRGMVPARKGSAWLREPRTGNLESTALPEVPPPYLRFGPYAGVRPVKRPSSRAWATPPLRPRPRSTSLRTTTSGSHARSSRAIWARPGSPAGVLPKWMLRVSARSRGATERGQGASVPPVAVDCGSGGSGVGADDEGAGGAGEADCGCGTSVIAATTPATTTSTRPTTSAATRPGRISRLFPRAAAGPRSASASRRTPRARPSGGPGRASAASGRSSRRWPRRAGRR